MVALENPNPRLLPAAVSVALHASLLALVLAFAARPAPPPTPADRTIVVDALSTALAPGAEVAPTPAAETPTAPSSVPEVAAGSTEADVKGSASTDLSATPPDAIPAQTSPADPVPAAEADAPPVAASAPADAAKEVQPTQPDAPTPQDVVPSAAPSAPLAASSDVPASVPATAADVSETRPANAAPATQSPDAIVQDLPAAASSDTAPPQTPSASTSPPAEAAASPPPADLESSAPLGAAPGRDVAESLADPFIDSPSQPAEVPTAPAGRPAVNQGLAPADVPVAVAQAGTMSLAEPEPVLAKPGGAVNGTVVDHSPAEVQPSSAAPPNASATVLDSLSVVPQDSVAQHLASADPVADAQLSSIPTAPSVTAVGAVPSATLDRDEPDSAPSHSNSPAPVQTAKLETGPSVAAMNAFVTGYDGGPCFLASVAHATSNGVAIDVLSDDKPKFRVLNDAFVAKFGLDPNILGQRVSAAQCPAVELLRRGRAGQIRLEVDRNKLRSGDTLTGTIGIAPEARAHLYAVTESGQIEDWTQYTRHDGDEIVFAAPIAHAGRGGPFPQLVIAVADDAGRPGSRLTFDGSFDPSRLAMAGKLVLVSNELTH